MTREELAKAIREDYERKGLWTIKATTFTMKLDFEMLGIILEALESKTGHWILQPSNKEQGERDFIWWKCSECGQVIYSETERDRREYHAFCGRCGAKMVESEE